MSESLNAECKTLENAEAVQAACKAGEVGQSVAEMMRTLTVH